MAIQGTQLGVLETIIDIQEATFVEKVEDIQIAEEIDLDVRVVRNALDALSQAGYVELEKVKTLSGIAYSAFLTEQGELALRESRSLMSEEI